MAASEPKEPPFYIVGLPESPLESAEAKLKFERLSREMLRAFPFVQEIRAVVKSKKARKDHARYEVSVELYTPKERHAFSESGYNIASVFDLMDPKIRRLLSSRQSKVTASRGDSRRKLVE